MLTSLVPIRENMKGESSMIVALLTKMMLLSILITEKEPRGNESNMK